MSITPLTSQAARNPLANGPRLRALALDDDAAVGRLLGKAAEAVGFATDAVTEPSAFRTCYRADTPDLVILDLHIGSSDGIEQLRFLHEQGYRNSVILLSGFDARVLTVAERYGRELGLEIAAALTKPIRMEALRQVLEDVRRRATPFLPADVIAAIAQGEMFLEYQPIVTRQPPALRQLEALVRWNHPKLGRIPPDRFIPLTEKAPEAIDALTQWVVATAAAKQRELAKSDIQVSMAVNISGHNLDTMEFPDQVMAILDAAAVPADRFCLELTESAASRDPVKSMNILSRLRLKGVSLAIDDFGTGYSSLVQLRQLPFSALKIDRSFVADMVKSRDAYIIVKSIADLARNMELDCIAEGVETEQMAGLIESLGVRTMQGYLIARPLSGEALKTWLTTFQSAGTTAANALRSLRA